LRIQLITQETQVFDELIMISFQFLVAFLSVDLFANIVSYAKHKCSTKYVFSWFEIIRAWFPKFPKNTFA